MPKLSLLCLSIALTGCVSLAPQYERPPLPTSAQWPVQTSNNQSTVYEPANWQSIYLDPQLQTLIQTALLNNKDFEMTLLNIDKARQTYEIQSGDTLPTVVLTGEQNAVNIEGNTSRTYTAGIGLSAYELDLFGKVASMRATDKATYFANIENQRTIQTALLAEMGANYVQYLTTSQLLALAERTLKTYENSLRLVGLREKAGIGNNLDTQRAQAQLNASQFDVANLKAQRERAKNALTYLAGTPIDWDHFNNTALSAHLIAPVPVGLPSDVLLVRPDIAAAEYSLQAANANIGAARAMRFPSITLTGLAGKTSGDLSGLWNGLNIWTFLPQITLPIFTGGSLAANVELANTSQKLAWANYEKTIQNAFKEVSDVLADQSTLFDQLQAKEKQRNALKKAERLADLRYQEGLDNYLFLLSAQRDLYASEQSLLLTQQSLLLNRILTYKALGGDRDLIADLPNTPNFINNNDEQVTEAS